MRSSLPALLATLSLVTACDRTPSSASTPAPAPPAPPAVARVDVAAAPAPSAEPPPAAPPVDPGDFARFGCSTDAMPPHIVAGRASVAWRPRGGGGAAFSYRNLPARCGAAFPGQIVEGARTRPGDGMEFVVCMPDERRLDIGILRRGPVAPGAVDVAHVENVVRLRIGLDRYVNVVAPAGTPDPVARLTVGARLRTASGAARLARTPGASPEGIVEFQIECGATR